MRPAIRMMLTMPAIGQYANALLTYTVSPPLGRRKKTLVVFGHKSLTINFIVIVVSQNVLLYLPESPANATL